MIKSKSSANQRDYNIITGAPNKFFSGSSQAFGRADNTVQTLNISNKRREQLLEKQKDNFKLGRLLDKKQKG